MMRFVNEEAAFYERASANINDAIEGGIWSQIPPSPWVGPSGDVVSANLNNLLGGSWQFG